MAQKPHNCLVNRRRGDEWTGRCSEGNRQSHLRHSGLTLIEILIVLAILGLMASAAVPCLSYALERGRMHDVEQRLRSSWELARAMALAENQPVLWTMRQDKDGITVTLAAEGGEEARRIELDGCSVSVRSGPSASRDGSWHVIVPSHGLTEAVELILERHGVQIPICLPGVLIPAITDQK